MRRNYGSFSSGIPTDNEGYCHLTIAGWRARRGIAPPEARDFWARRAKEAVKEADAALNEWRNQ